MNPLAEALNLAAHGIASFPCLTSKAPAVARGFHAATSDPAELRSLWRAHPGELIGVPTGERNGFDALDIDPKNTGTVWFDANRYRMPLTRTHETRSGGLHLLFIHAPDVRNTASRIAPGVDTRGEGGFIIWWAAAGYSVQAETVLAAWPAWLLDALLAKPEPTFKPAPMNLHGEPRAIARAREIIGRVLFRLRVAPPGQRHYRLRAAARTIGGIMDAANIVRIPTKPPGYTEVMPPVVLI